MKRANRLTPNRLRHYRLLAGYEQWDVADLLGLNSHARISEWEQGISKPSLDNLMQLSIIYRTLIDDLYYDLRHEFVKLIAERERLWLARQNRSG